MGKLSARSLFVVLFFLSLFLVGVDAYLQYHYQFLASYLDHAERLIMLALTVVFLMGALHIYSGTATKIYYLLTLIISSLGLFVSGHHVWIEKHASALASAMPPDITPQLQHALSWHDLLVLIYTGTESSARVQWAGLGITLTEWTFLCFLLFFAIAALAWMINSSQKKG